MGNAPIPKQYLRVAGKAVIEWSVHALLEDPHCAGVVVALSQDDVDWPHLALARHPKVWTTTGGAQRQDSVRAGLQALNLRAQPRDWVLVHDAARPCLSSVELRDLLEVVRDDDTGGLLAAPVVDTLKRSDAIGRVECTIDRERLWRALTPQMFRLDVLSRALEQAAGRGIAATDEAQAVEWLGLKPRLVQGSTENIKITIAEDLVRAEAILAARLPKDFS
jgi:2-C-methyl-D-erythritol 4-phosphate cytidylyltransferase